MRCDQCGTLSVQSVHCAPSRPGSPGPRLPGPVPRAGVRRIRPEWSRRRAKRALCSAKSQVGNFPHSLERDADYACVSRHLGGTPAAGHQRRSDGAARGGAMARGETPAAGQPARPPARQPRLARKTPTKPKPNTPRCSRRRTSRRSPRQSARETPRGTRTISATGSATWCHKSPRPRCNSGHR